MGCCTSLLYASGRTPSIRGGTVTLNSFTYTLTFVGFGSPYITIAATDP